MIHSNPSRKVLDSGFLRRQNLRNGPLNRRGRYGVPDGVRLLNVCLDKLHCSNQLAAGAGKTVLT
jgi:hypothetical protein